MQIPLDETPRTYIEVWDKNFTTRIEFKTPVMLSDEFWIAWREVRAAISEMCGSSLKSPSRKPISPLSQLN